MTPKDLVGCEMKSRKQRTSRTLHLAASLFALVMLCSFMTRARGEGPGVDVERSVQPADSLPTGRAPSELLAGGQAQHLSLIAPHLRFATAEPLRNVLLPRKAGGDSDTVAKATLRRPAQGLPGEEGSVSLGDVTDGQLLAAHELALDAEHWRVLPHYRPRGLRFATDEFVAMVEQAAREVALRFPGSILGVGNFSGPAGGDIPYSVSHNAGRDGDFAFYVRDEDGRMAFHGAFSRFTDSGRSYYSEGAYRFDTARNWAFVEALLRSEHAEIQYIFVSDGLRALLLEHAEQSGVSAALRDRATVVLRQPGARIPHDEHFHVRIFCNEEDSAAGCVDTGARHGWAPDRYGARQRGIERALSSLNDAAPEVRRAAIDRLRVLNARDELDVVRTALSDESPMVRAAAVRALGTLSGRSDARLLAERFAEEPSNEVLMAVVETLAARNDVITREAFEGWLQDAASGTPFAVFVRAPADAPKSMSVALALIDAAADVRSHGIVEALIGLLGHSSREVRARANEALRRLTNAAPLADLDVRQLDHTSEELVALRSSWEAWLQSSRYRRETPAQWVLRGFDDAGYPLAGDPESRVAQLAEIAGESRFWLRENAIDVLSVMLDHERPASLYWHPEEAALYWFWRLQRHYGPFADYR